MNSTSSYTSFLPSSKKIIGIILVNAIIITSLAMLILTVENTVQLENIDLMMNNKAQVDDNGNIYWLEWQSDLITERYDISTGGREKYFIDHYSDPDEVSLNLMMLDTNNKVSQIEIIRNVGKIFGVPTINLGITSIDLTVYQNSLWISFSLKYFGEYLFMISIDLNGSVEYDNMLLSVLKVPDKYHVREIEFDTNDGLIGLGLIERDLNQLITDVTSPNAPFEVFNDFFQLEVDDNYIAISTINISDINNWKRMGSNDFPISTYDILMSINNKYEFFLDFGPHIFPNYAFYYNDIVFPAIDLFILDQTKNISRALINNILSTNYGNVQEINGSSIIELSNLYYIDQLGFDNIGNIHFSTLSFNRINNHTSQSMIDYVVIDVEESKIYLWDLIDTPTINFEDRRGFSYKLWNGVTFYLVSGGLDLKNRLNPEYNKIRNDSTKLDEFIENADNLYSINLGWFDPLDITPMNLTNYDVSVETNQTNFITVIDTKYDLLKRSTDLSTLSPYFPLGNVLRGKNPTYIVPNAEIEIYLENGAYKLFFAFSDNGFTSDITANDNVFYPSTYLYQVDVNTILVHDSIEFIGEIVTVSGLNDADYNSINPKDFSQANYPVLSATRVINGNSEIILFLETDLELRSGLGAPKVSTREIFVLNTNEVKN